MFFILSLYLNKNAIVKTMKTWAILILLIAGMNPNQFGLAQPQLSEIDTILDYKSRFFRNDSLNCMNQSIYRDSATGLFYFDESQLASRLGKSCFYILKHGLWVYFWDKKWKECDKSNAAYYQLFEYNHDTFIGKAYTFNKNNELLHSIEPYPIFENEVFNGYLKLSYQNEVVYSAEYKQWEDDIFKNFYFNYTQFYSNGSIQSFSFLDDAKYRHRTIIIDKSGFCTFDLKLDKYDSYRIERKKNGTRIKEIIRIKEDNQGLVIFKKNGEVVRKKQAKGRFRLYNVRGVKWWFW